MPFAEDSTMMINDATPGYVQASVGGTLVDALLIDSAADDFGVGGFQDELHCIPAQVATATRGTPVTIGASNYKVRATPDISDPGVTVLLLEKA